MLIVQKFGGTSVSTPQGRQAAVGKVQEAMDTGARPVVVVSAMGRSGAPYATATGPFPELAPAAAKVHEGYWNK